MTKLFSIILCLATGALQAQQAATPHKTMVTHQFNPATDVWVRLLGESGSSARLASPAAPMCAARSVSAAETHAASLKADTRLAGQLDLPARWTSQTIPAVPQSETGRWTTMVARLNAPSASGGDLQAQVYVSYGTEEGYPSVLLTKDSKITSLTECHTTLASGHPASVIRAAVVTPERGQLTYVVGYAKVGANRWVTFLASSSNDTDADELSTIFQSMAIASAK